MSEPNSDHVFAPPPAGYPPGYAPLASLQRVPWEDPGRPLFGRWWATTKSVLLQPTALFAAGADNPSPWPALSYALLTTGMTTMLAVVSMGLPAALRQRFDLVLAVLAFVPALLAPFLFAAAAHLTLRLSGAATRPYASSLRVFAYCGACQIWALLPFVGTLAALVLGAVAATAGLAATHRCTKGKAALAVLLLPSLGFLVLAGFMFLLLLRVAPH